MLPPFNSCASAASAEPFFEAADAASSGRRYPGEGVAGAAGAAFSRQPLVDPFLGLSVGEVEKLAPGGTTSARAAFPTVFAVLCLAAFLVPIWTSVHLSYDDNVQYFLGGRALAASAFLPALYAVSLLIHLVRGAPVRLAIVCSICGTCGFLMIVNFIVLVDSGRIGVRLGSEDCGSFAVKRNLEKQWREVSSFFDECANKIAADRGLDAIAVRETIRVTDCPGYRREANKPGDGTSGWSYLHVLEERLHCSGWCEERPPLWTYGAKQDSCSEAASMVMLTKVRATSLQVVVYSGIVFAFSCFGFVEASPLLRRNTPAGEFTSPW